MDTEARYIEAVVAEAMAVEVVDFKREISKENGLISVLLCDIIFLMRTNVSGEKTVKPLGRGEKVL